MVTEVVGLSIFFCIGVAKSGTTLLARVLDQHPNIACIWESYAFHPRSSASIWNPASQSWRKHGFAEQDVQRWADVWAVEPKAFVRRVLRRLTGRSYFVTSCFRRTMSSALVDFAQRCNARVVGDKWPQYSNYLEQVLEAFPDAKFIYSVRDPRGLWNSAQKFKERKRGDELLHKMLDADERVAPYLKLENFWTIRYEDLVCKPEKTCQQLYEFLGCGFSSEYLHYDREADPYPERWDWIPEASRQFEPWHTIKWKEQMSQQDIERVTDLAGWFIDKYQYEC